MNAKSVGCLPFQSLSDMKVVDSLHVVFWDNSRNNSSNIQ
jgi:hypothetical protein